LTEHAIRALSAQVHELTERVARAEANIAATQRPHPGELAVWSVVAHLADRFADDLDLSDTQWAEVEYLQRYTGVNVRGKS
jgi:hypothetical protein